MIDTNPARTQRRQWKRLAGAATVAAMIVGGAGVVAAARHDGPGSWHHGDLDPDTAKRHVDFMTGWALSEIDATDAQRREIDIVLEAAIDDLFLLRDSHRANRAAFRDVLMQTEIDRLALEELRQAQMELADEASRRLVEAVADVAEQLTLEQRAQLAEIVESHHR